MNAPVVRLRVLPAIPPIDGRDIELRATETHIQSRLEGEDWRDLIALSELEGPKGDNVVMRVSNGFVQWRLETQSDDEWIDLIALEDITGPMGGEGPEGPQGPQGEPGTTDYNELENRPNLSAVATSGDYDDLSNRPTLGTAAAEDVGAFASAVQGERADTALQPANNLSDLADPEAATGNLGYLLPLPGAITRPVLSRLADGVHANDFGLASATTEQQRTNRLQAAIDAVFNERGGGSVYIADGDYSFAPSELTETYWNSGATQTAAATCIVQRKGVSLIGTGRNRCRLFNPDRTKNVLLQVAPEQCTLKGFEICSDWTMGSSGAAHALSTISTENGADKNCKRNVYEDLYIHNVGSYAIGLQTGSPQFCIIKDVEVYHVGADALDLKTRDQNDQQPWGNSVENVLIREHGLRVTGSAGIDCRGLWKVRSVQVVDFGRNPALDYVGVRFRTKYVAEGGTYEGYVPAARFSTLSDFYIRPLEGSESSNLRGVDSGSDDCQIASGTIENCHKGVYLTGNAAGSAERNSIASVNAIGCDYGFHIGAGVQNTKVVGCTSKDCTTFGFRDDAQKTTFVGCDDVGSTTALSTSTSASGNQIVIGCGFSDATMSVIAPTLARIALTARGVSSDIDLSLGPKGSGNVRFPRTKTTGPDVACDGFITVKDGSGATIKLMTTA